MDFSLFAFQKLESGNNSSDILHDSACVKNGGEGGKGEGGRGESERARCSSPGAWPYLFGSGIGRVSFLNTLDTFETRSLE